MEYIFADFFSQEFIFTGSIFCGSLENSRKFDPAKMSYPRKVQITILYFTNIRQGLLRCLHMSF